METPFTPDDKLNTDALANEVKFLNRGRVAGMIWPVFASSWSTLSDAERMEGAETILAAGKGGRTAMAIAGPEYGVGHSYFGALCEACGGAWGGRDSGDSAEQWVECERPGGDRLLQDDCGGDRAAADCADARDDQRGLMLEMFKQIPTMKATKDEVAIRWRARAS